MKLDSKVKGGLAWAGLFVILAVPSADLLFGNDDAPSANLAVTPTAPKPVVPAAKAELMPVLKADPVETASIATPAAKSDDPVDTYLQKGKKLPSYISDADTAPAVKPAVPVTPVKQPVEVAAINPVQETPPLPLPRDARPKAAAVPVVASVPAVTPAAPAEQPLIIDEADLAQREATLSKPKPRIEPFPLSDEGMADDVVVTGDQLEEWDSGSLADYLERKGLLSEQASAQEDEFVFNEGPVQRRKPLESFFLF